MSVNAGMVQPGTPPLEFVVVSLGTGWVPCWLHTACHCSSSAGNTPPRARMQGTHGHAYQSLLTCLHQGLIELGGAANGTACATAIMQPRLQDTRVGCLHALYGNWHWLGGWI